MGIRYTAKCRVCGKEYETCHTENISNVFRWQDVACSPECGAEYLRQAQETNLAVMRATNAATEKGE